VRTPAIIVAAPPAPVECIVCGKPLAGTGLDKAALMVDERGQPRGWGHPHHAIDLPKVILRSTKRARCARCALPLLGDHGVTQGAGFCRDGGPFILADAGDLNAEGELDRTKHSTTIVEIVPEFSPTMEEAA
jgi:hypothetical protein